MEFGELLHSLSSDPAGGWRTEVPPDWTQGRTLYGGANAALAAQSARRLDEDLGPLRALQIAFIAPAAGELTYLPSVLRRGRSVSFVGVDCHAGSGLAARAVLTYGASRASDLASSRVSPPPVPEPEACPELSLERAPSAPAFFQHMDLRFAAGSALMSGADPSFSLWVRHRDASGLDAESGAVGIADALPPAVLASATVFRPASSVTWSVDFVAPLPDPGGWYLLSTSSDHVADGYSLVALSCFDAERRLVAVGRQTQAVF